MPNRRGDPHTSNRPTYFEIITALALLRFAEHRVDAAVLEVGLGGRLDSTNVCQPLVSVITSISFDHTQQLGNTLAAIAAEKAGIIKPGNAGRQWRGGRRTARRGRRRGAAASIVVWRNWESISISRTGLRAISKPRRSAAKWIFLIACPQRSTNSRISN